MKPDATTPNHALQPTGVRVTAHASRHLRPQPPSPAHGPRHARPWLSLGSLGQSARLLPMKDSASDSRLIRFPSSGALGVSCSPSLANAAIMGLGLAELSTQGGWPNHALEPTATLAFSCGRAAPGSTGSVTAYAPAMKPGIRRAFALRRLAATRAPRSRSLSLGSLAVARAL